MPSFTRATPSDLVRVGMITGNGGHTHAIWGNNMNPPVGHIRTTGMVMTHAWTIKPDMAERLQSSFQGLKIVQHPADMIGHVDGVYIDDISAISLYPLLAKPFLEAGIPTFVNRPFATSLAKGQAMVDVAAKHGTALLTASTWEYTESVGDLRAKAANMTDIKGYVAHNSMSDYYSHGLHGVWYIHAILRDEIKKGRGKMIGAAYHTANWRKYNGLVIYEHDHPSHPYYGSLQLVSGADGQAYMRIFGDHQGDAEGKIPGRPGYFRYNTWNALQLVIQEMFETGKSPETTDELMEKLTMFLLPFYSILECDGTFVRRDELGDWELPNPSPVLMRDGEPTDSAFQQPYTEAELEAVEQMLSPSV